MAKKYDLDLEQKIVNEYIKGMSPYTMVKTFPELNGKRPSVIYGILKRKGIPVRKPQPRSDEIKRRLRKYNLNDEYFDCIHTEEKAYWLGFIYADGYITTTENKIGISLSIKDKSHLEKFKKAVGFTGPINDYEVKEGYSPGVQYSRILLTSEHMKQSLISKGVFENKTEILKFPTHEQVPIPLHRHFVRGYIDGDGSITYGSKINYGIGKNYSIKITGTYEIIEGIKKFFHVEHLKIEQRYPERNVNNYSLTIGGNAQVLYLLTNLYGNSTIYLERKYNRFKQLETSFTANARGDREL